MNDLQLVTGNRNFSSSSLRAWLLLKETGVPFEEIRIALYQSDTAEKLGFHSPSLKVPVLCHNGLRIWDSLAICDYVSETFLESQGWPRQLNKKVTARSVVAELHADFQHLKREWPMNCHLSVKLRASEKIEQEIARLDAIIYCYRRKFGDGGDYLFGSFSIADCFLAPFAISLSAYGAILNQKSRHYLQALLDNPHVQCWLDDAQEETLKLPLDKAG
ncbi:MAG: glutathione S-transferase [Pseudomonadales bacterium]|nr:glutathione S-transferase [Pseudomonadales bacterium]